MIWHIEALLVFTYSHSRRLFSVVGFLHRSLATARTTDQSRLQTLCPVEDQRAGCLIALHNFVSRERIIFFGLLAFWMFCFHEGDSTKERTAWRVPWCMVFCCSAQVYWSGVLPLGFVSFDFLVGVAKMWQILPCWGGYKRWRRQRDGLWLGYFLCCCCPYYDFTLWHTKNEKIPKKNHKMGERKRRKKIDTFCIKNVRKHWKKWFLQRFSLIVVNLFRPTRIVVVIPWNFSLYLTRSDTFVELWPMVIKCCAVIWRLLEMVACIRLSE